jgi:hypothetical protein
MASDRLTRRQVLSHIEVMPQRRMGLFFPQFWSVTAFGVALE